MNKAKPVKWYDQVFQANKRTANNAVMALAKWLDIEHLVKLHNKAVEQEK